LKEPIDGDCLIQSGMEFQTVGAAKLKASRPMAVVVKGTCSRLCEEERRSLEGALRLMRDESCSEQASCRARSSTLIEHVNVYRQRKLRCIFV